MYVPAPGLLIVNGEELMPVTFVDVVPLLYVILNGPAPVSVITTSGGVCPWQTVPPPDTVAVGNGKNVTVAVPLPEPTQSPSCIETIAYVPAPGLVMVYVELGNPVETTTGA